MKGLELAKRYYEEFGRPMIREKFPELEPYLAVGLAGSGSECLGFDDEVSLDHDFGPGFCIWLPGEDIIGRKAEFELERAYAALPSEFEGFSRPKLAPVGGARKGVLRMDDFFSEKTGRPDGELDTGEWLAIPMQSLCEAVNGEVFSDPYGRFTAIREKLRNMPRDVRLKRMAGHLLLMAQSGQYNYLRCMDHGEGGAAQLASFEFAKNAVTVIFLLNGRYEPFYKWAFRALRELPLLAELEPVLTGIISSPNDLGNAYEKSESIEAACAEIIKALRTQGLTDADCGDLEKHAYSVNDHIADPGLRNMHSLSGV
jgi:hypothetical protein